MHCSSEYDDVERGVIADVCAIVRAWFDDVETHALSAGLTETISYLRHDSRPSPSLTRPRATSEATAHPVLSGLSGNGRLASG